MARILLAEDDDFIGRMISMRLSLRGHQVEVAVNGREAVDKALAENYAVILMDMHMPIMDGHEAARTLRDKGYTGVIIAVTASVMTADSQKALTAGCDHYIAKPIGADFEDRIEALL